MAEVEIVFQNGQDFEVLFFDVDVEQQYSLRAEMTESPVERAASRGDNHRGKPDEYSEELIVSDSPLDNSGASGQLTRRRDAWALLERARDLHLPCLITTPLKTYDEMYFLEATATRSAKDGTWLRARVHFKQMEAFSTQLVRDPTPLRPRGRPQTPLGAQSTTDLSAEQARRSSGLYDLIGGG